MKYIFLRSSELAKLTGHNTYQPKEKVINELLSRNGIMSIYIPSSNTEEGLLGLQETELNQLKIELGLNQDVPIQKVEAVIKSSVISGSYSGDLSEETSKQLIDDKIRDKPILRSLEEGMKQDLRMRRGNIKEKSNLNKDQKKLGTITNRNSRMYTKELYRNDKYALIIRGKVDGLSDNKIIETKNRTNRLFKVLRPYEQVQLEAYMFLTEIENAILTEHYNDESHELYYSHDQQFWGECMEKIVLFIDTHVSPHI